MPVNAPLISWNGFCFKIKMIALLSTGLRSALEFCGLKLHHPFHCAVICKHNAGNEGYLPLDQRHYDFSLRHMATAHTNTRDRSASNRKISLETKLLSFVQIYHGITYKKIKKKKRKTNLLKIFSKHLFTKLYLENSVQIFMWAC